MVPECCRNSPNLGRTGKIQCQAGAGRYKQIQKKLYEVNLPGTTYSICLVQFAYHFNCHFIIVGMLVDSLSAKHPQTLFLLVLVPGFKFIINEAQFDYLLVTSQTQIKQ